MELNQLLPDNLVSMPTPSNTEGDTKSKEKRKLPPITDIQSWCLSMLLYTAIIQATYPHKMGKLLAYMATRVQTSTTYPTEACLSYDRVFRTQAHLKPHFNWAGDNNRLWNEKFSGRGVPKPCGHCTSILMVPPQLPSKQLHAPTALPPPLKTPHKEGELCMGFNLGRCSVFLCARPQLCYRCHLSHPLLQCPSARGFLKGKFPVSQSSKGPRTSSQQ